MEETIKKIISKTLISIEEWRTLAYADCVSEVMQVDNDNLYKDSKKYKVTIVNSDNEIITQEYVYVKF